MKILKSSSIITICLIALTLIGMTYELNFDKILSWTVSDVEKSLLPVWVWLTILLLPLTITFNAVQFLLNYFNIRAFNPLVVFGGSVIVLVAMAAGHYLCVEPKAASIFTYGVEYALYMFFFLSVFTSIAWLGLSNFLKWFLKEHFSENNEEM